MRSFYRVHELLFTLLSYLISISSAQNSPGALTETINSHSAFSSQKPCAQGCFINPNFGCTYDLLGRALGCNANGVCGGQTWPATNDCFCRTDLQPAASSYLNSCVRAGCTVGDASIDVSSAQSIYGAYCGGFAKAVSTPAATKAGGAANTATPANTATSPGSTQTSGSSSDNNNAQGGSGNQNVNVNIGNKSSAHTQNVSKIAIGVAVPVLILTLAATAFWWFIWRKRHPNIGETHDTNELQSVPGRDKDFGREFRSELGANGAKENSTVREEVKPAVKHGAVEVHADSRPRAYELG